MVAIWSRAELRVFTHGVSADRPLPPTIPRADWSEREEFAEREETDMTPSSNDYSAEKPAIWVVEPLESDERIWQSVLEISEFQCVKISTSADSLPRAEALQVGAVIVASSASDDEVRLLNDVLEARGQAAAAVVRWDPARVEELRARWSSIEP